MLFLGALIARHALLSSTLSWVARYVKPSVLSAGQWMRDQSRTPLCGLMPTEDGVKYNSDQKRRAD